MTEYYIPTGRSETRLVEKRSEFIGRVWRVESEEEARACIEAVRKNDYDARHNCWCYIIREGNILRYSDDSEPQGTAGQPMLNVFQRENITNVCCVVTRYFGGILLGAGGLARAYTKGAKDALTAAGICRVGLWTLWDIPCSYSLFERIRLEVEACGGMVRSVDYGADVIVLAAFPVGGAETFEPRLKELSAGGFTMTCVGEERLPGLREEI